MKSLTRFLLLLIVGIGIFIAYLLVMNPETITAEILKANIWLLLLAFPLDVAFMLLFGIGWYVLLKSIEKNVPLKGCIAVAMISLFGDVMIPTGTVTGEAIRLALAKKKLNVGFNKALASIIVHRIVNLMAFIFYFILGLALFWSIESSNIGLLAILVLALIAMGGGLFCIRYLSKSKSAQEFLRKVSEKILKTFKKGNYSNTLIEYNINEFCQAVDTMFSRPYVILISFTIFIGQWAAAITIPYIVFMSLGHEVPYSLVAAAYPIYSLSLMIPIGIPAMLGVVETSMTATFVALGVPSTIASSASILTRMIVVWFEVAVTGSITAIYSADVFSELFKKSGSRNSMHSKEPKTVASPQRDVG